MEQMNWRARPGELDMPRSEARVAASSVFLARVFNWMMIGLGLTGAVAWMTAHSPLLPMLLSSGLYWALFVAELVMVFVLASRIDKMQATTATGLFVGYAVLNGVTLSTLFLAYSGASLASTFFITAGMFGAMALYGLVTRRDLTGLGSFLFMGLIGLLLAMVVNFFLHSSTLDLAISVIGVFIFVGLTAYDTQKIKTMGEQGIMEQGAAAVRKGAIIGALTLYLDFINLFIMLLRLFGGGRD